MLGKKKRQVVTFETLLERETKNRSARKFSEKKVGVLTKIVQKAAACLC